MNTQKTLSLYRLIRGFIIIALLLAGSASATDLERTILVRPGDAGLPIAYAPELVLIDTYGPFHGNLTQETKGFFFEPNATFWDVSTDLLILELHDPTTGEQFSERIRLVAATTALDSVVTTHPDPNAVPTPLYQWVVDDNMVNWISGLLNTHAFEVLTHSSAAAGIYVKLPDDDASGNATSTSTTSVDVDVHDIGVPLGPPLAVPFYRIREGSTDIVDITATAIQGQFQVALANSDNDPTNARAVLVDGLNRLRLVRWHDATVDSSGADLFVNNVFVGTIDTPLMTPGGTETHEILTTQVPGSQTVMMVVENPKGSRSRNLMDTTTRLHYDSFTGGADSNSTVINGWAHGLATQNLPGPGDQFEVDLGLLANLESSFLETPVAHITGGEDDPEGFAMRLWIDPTGVTMPANTSVRVATACSESGNCGAARIWFGHDGTDYTIAATAWRDGSPGARIEVPVTAEPHNVEVRLTHGWTSQTTNGSVELWVDGELKGRIEGLNNHASQIAKVRLGIFRDVYGTSGIIGLDDFEAWRFVP